MFSIRQKWTKHKWPTKLFSLRLIIGRSDKLSKFFVCYRCFINEEGFYADNFGWHSSTIQWMLLCVSRGIVTSIGLRLSISLHTRGILKIKSRLTKPSKWLRALGQIQLSPSLFVQHLLPRLTMRSIRDIMSGIWTVVLMVQVCLFDFLVCIIESCAKDVFDPYVWWQWLVEMQLVKCEYDL